MTNNMLTKKEKRISEINSEIEALKEVSRNARTVYVIDSCEETIRHLNHLVEDLTYEIEKLSLVIENNKFIPGKMDDYYYINSDFSVRTKAFLRTGDDYDRICMTNCFETEEEAESKRDEVLQKLNLCEYFKMY